MGITGKALALLCRVGITGKAVVLLGRVGITGKAVVLLGTQGRGSLVGCHLWGRTVGHN